MQETSTARTRRPRGDRWRGGASALLAGLVATSALVALAGCRDHRTIRRVDTIRSRSATRATPAPEATPPPAEPSTGSPATMEEPGGETPITEAIAQ